MGSKKKTDSVITHVETRQGKNGKEMRAHYASVRGRRLPGVWVPYADAVASGDVPAFLRQHDDAARAGRKASSTE